MKVSSRNLILIGISGEDSTSYAFLEMRID